MSDLLLRLFSFSGLGNLTLPEIAGQVADGQPNKQARNFIQKCILCGRCTRHCPSAVDVPAMVTAARTVLAETDPVSLELYRPVWVDYDWNIFTIYRDTYRVDYRDLVKINARRYSSPAVLCPAMRRSLTRASFDWLSERSGHVGLSLSCCGLPLAQMGAAERAAKYMATLRQSVNATGARRIDNRLPHVSLPFAGTAPGLAGTEVVSRYQLMAEAGVGARRFPVAVK